MLKIQFKDQQRKPFWVMEDNFSIGSGSDNNLVLDQPGISETHVKFFRNQGGNFRVQAQDASSLSINGASIGEAELQCGDEILLGDLALQVVDPLENTENAAAPYWSLIANSSWLSGQEFPLQALPGSNIVIGRGSQCDLVFAGTHLSRRHAEISIGENGLIIRDLESANGTYVNEKRVKEAELKAGDSLRLDVYTFKVFGPGIDLPAASTTARFRAVTDQDVEKAQAEGRKNWKTRSTSPGNRIEPENKQGKIFAWVSGAVLVSLLLVAAFYIVVGF